MPVRVLADFEQPAQRAFVAAPGGKTTWLSNGGHTGHGAVRISAEAGEVRIDLSRIAPGEQLPGQWTLLGLFIRSDADASMTIGYEIGGTMQSPRRLTVRGDGQYHFVALDLSTLSPLTTGHSPPESISTAGAALVLRFDAALVGPIDIDDVALVNDRRTLITRDDGRAAGVEPWMIEQKGFATIIDAMPHFRIVLDDVQQKPDGWRVEEFSPLRIVARSADAKRCAVYYHDGRALATGQLSIISASLRPMELALRQSHEHPLHIDVEGEGNRLERTRPGDTNNDGYDETMGCYGIIATGQRLDVLLTPDGGAVMSPVLEISGMPASGRIMATVDGRLADRICRTSTGRILVELPGSIDRPCHVDVSVR